MADDTQLILQAIKSQGDKIGSLADAVNRLVDKVGNVPIGDSRNGRYAIALMITILAACFGPLVFALKIHMGATGHEGMDGRVSKIERTLHGEDKRNTKIERQIYQLFEEADDWRSIHDRRVLPLNTAQSKKGEELGRLQQIIWQNCMPPDIGPYPTDVSGWPRIEP